MNAHTIEVDEKNFEALVVEGSKSAPVLVDFWAPWCGPCRALTPVLEKLAAEYSGRFVLAKVNSDDNPGLATRFGVRGIPNVKAFSGGRVVDEFTGAQPESAVRQFLARIVPSPVDALREEALALYARSGDVEAALEILARAEALDPKNEHVRVDRAEIFVEAGRGDEARKAIATLTPLSRMQERVSALEAKLDLAQGAADAPSEAGLRQRIEKNADDLDARLSLAHTCVARGEHREALEQLLEVVRRDRSFGDDVARKTMLKVFELLGNQGELVSEFRRRLATVMNR